MSNKKKKTLDLHDDNDMSIFGDDFDAMSMKQFESYEEFDISKKSTDLQKTAESIINGIADAYLSISSDAEEDENIIRAKQLVKNIKLIETSNLHAMIEQVHIAKHLLHTMMRRLDSGGHVHDSLFELIQEQQKQLMSIVLQFSKYARNLPDYFSLTKSELSSAVGIDVQQMQQLNSSSQQIMLTDGNANETFSHPPMRGTLDLALSVQESIKRVSEKYSSAEDNPIDFDPAELTIDDDEDDDIFNQQD